MDNLRTAGLYNPRLAWASAAAAGKAALETCYIWFRSLDDLLRKTSVRRPRASRKSNMRRRRLAATGAGIIILTPHIGSFELSARAYASLAPITVLYKAPRREDLHQLLKVARTHPQHDARACRYRRRAGAAARAQARRGDRHPAGPGAVGGRRGLGAVLRPAGLHHDAAGAARGEDRRAGLRPGHLAAARSAAAGTASSSGWSGCRRRRRSTRSSRPSSGGVRSSTSGATTGTRSRRASSARGSVTGGAGR